MHFGDVQFAWPKRAIQVDRPKLRLLKAEFSFSFSKNYGALLPVFAAQA